ncbi:hypothetical protein AVEN_134279-1 [Araneus ventricosus]|uniref:Secreted protein n=1 Tax=Araneus ventricosus TaxID=182803 RepID=A0A4Y2UMP4_ARAVE|nr:hypothetical protein AVEN_134279-1 [Araneus ventricosus]
MKHQHPETSHFRLVLLLPLINCFVISNDDVAAIPHLAFLTVLNSKLDYQIFYFRFRFTVNVSWRMLVLLHLLVSDPPPEGCPQMALVMRWSCWTHPIDASDRMAEGSFS